MNALKLVSYAYSSLGMQDLGHKNTIKVIIADSSYILEQQWVLTLIFPCGFQIIK